ncbi:MAG: hypothetical protein Q8Q69_04145 [Nitrosopumilaceae archaeon]|nr:hypothetical protein [Nitrosopumilaceae archaeon]
MLLDILIICSLIQASPYYDCSEHWIIEIHDEPVLCNIGQDVLVAGCTNFETKTVRVYDYAMFSYDKDEYGFTVLEHELEHLKCMCGFHS